MRNFRKCFSVLLLTSLFTATVASAEAVSDTQTTYNEEPIAIAEKYFEAVKNNDAEGLIEYSIDPSFPDEASRKAYYEDVDSNVDSYKIIDEENTNNSEIHFKVILTDNDGLTLPAVPYSLIKKNDEWKVLIEYYEIDMDKQSSTYGDISETTPLGEVEFIDIKVEKKGDFSTTAEKVGYSFRMTDQVEGSSTFTSSSSYATFHGWQTYPNTNGNPDITYGIIKRVGNTVTSYGSTRVQGFYPDYDSSRWYSQKLIFPTAI
ncbi:hypothetical protein D3C74_44000 [compost metagenome]